MRWIHRSIVTLWLALTAPAMSAPSAPASPAHIEWDRQTLTLVAPGGGYARMIRLRNGDILCGCSRQGKIYVRTSRDNGKTWADEALVCDSPFGAATNAELLQLQNGWILLSYNERPNDGVHPYAIKTCLSRDNGRAWSAPALVYEAGAEPRSGCWEPAAIQLPTGEIQIFFANEFPRPGSKQQEISMMRSLDNAATWSAPIAVSFRPGHRDGMPAPLLLRDGKGIVIAIEDNGLVRGPFKPSIVWTSLADNWDLPAADGASPRRWGALDPPLPADWHAAAPYIRQMPSGETVLSFQIDHDAKGAKHELFMAVCVGDPEAKRFGGMTYPFDLPSEQAGQWNSLFVKDDKTVTAVSGTRLNGQGGIWAIDGCLVRGQ